MAIRNSLADRTTGAEKTFCCVTTRRQTEPFRAVGTRRPVVTWEHVGGGLVPPRRAADAFRAPPAALAAASLPASDARPAGNGGPDSIAGSTAVLDRAAHSPWQGKIAIPPLWSNHPHRRYAAHVSWEVYAPLRQPGEDVRASSSGTYPLLGPASDRPLPRALDSRRRTPGTRARG